MAPCNLEDDFYREARRTWLCNGCSAPNPSVGRIDVRLSEPQINGVLNFVFEAEVSLARLSVLLSLGQERVHRDLHLGKVWGPDGEELSEWVTCRGRQRLIVRGTKNVTHRVCSVCGRNVYFAMPPWYLYPAPGEGAEIFETNLCGLMTTDSIARKAGIAKQRGVVVDRLQILKEPRDGLPPLEF